eukprot:UN07258
MTAIIAVFCWFGRRTIAHLYAPQESHKQIRHVMENCLRILAVYIMIDQVQRCGQGAIRGMGMQKIGAMVNLVSYYLCGIPLGLYLCFKQDWKVSGLWIGMCVACSVSSIVFIVLRFRINWREQVKQTFQRIQEKQKKIDEFKVNEYKQSLEDNDENCYMLHDNEDNYEQDMEQQAYNSINSNPN